MEAHAEVGEHAVHGFDAVVVHEVAEVAEIAVNHGETRVAGGGCAFHSILVLVEAVEVSAGVEAFEYGRRMAAAAVGGVDVDAPGRDAERVDGWHE